MPAYYSNMLPVLWMHDTRVALRFNAHLNEARFKHLVFIFQQTKRTHYLNRENLHFRAFLLLLTL